MGRQDGWISRGIPRAFTADVWNAEIPDKYNEFIGVNKNLIIFLVFLCSPVVLCVISSAVLTKEIMRQ